MKTFAYIYKWFVVSIFLVCAAAISSNAQPSNSITPPAGLVSWWKAEGNGLDSIGGNTAYAPLLPGGVTFSPGEVGQGFELNGTNAYLVVPASPSLNVGMGTGLTLEGWIKVGSVEGLHPIAEWYSDVRDILGVQFWINSSPSETGELLAVLIDTNSNRQALTSPSGILQPNVFQHVAMTYDQASGMTTIYINGAAVAHANMGSFVPQTSYNLWIGHRPFDAPGDWTYGATLGGVLDEFSLYNRALSSNEVAAIYNAGAAGKGGATNSTVAPLITHQPTNQTVAAGANATFTVTASGSPTLHYQWYGPSETLIPGATASTLTLSNVQPGAAGAYFVQVTNQAGFAASSNAVLTVTGSSSNSCTPPPSGLVGWWKGENNTLDSAGSNHGFLVGGPISYAPGEVGSAFLYDDSGDYVAVPPAPSLNVGLGSGFTLEAWIQPGDIQNQIPLFEWQYDTNTDANGIHFWVSAIGGPGCLFANIVDSNFTSHWIYSAPGLVTADYQHVALTYDKSSGVASIYRNGVLVTTQNLGSFTPNTTGNLLLGERTYLNNEPQYHYVGGLDEMSVYNRALSQSEIAAIYNAGSAGKCGGTNSSMAPVITRQPTNQTVAVGGTATFSVMATGSPAVPLHFQWYGPESTLIPGATHSVLTLSNVQPDAAGAYFVLVTNVFGFAKSSNATLTVTGSGPSATGLILPNYSASNQISTADGSLNQPLREQMVYASSQFPPHPIVITEIRWRPDLNAAGPLSVTISNLQIKLSTTTATPDHLSTTFTQNTGPDETVAFSGAATISTAFTTLNNGTKAFDISIPLKTPFTYDPSKGDLLVDLLNLYGCTPARTPQYNIVNGTDGIDAVSRVFSIYPNAAIAETADTGGDVLEIIYTVSNGTSNSCTPPPSGLVGWWKGEGNANDSVGGNNGTLVDGLGFAAGEVGQGFLFTHTNQNVLIPASSNLDVGQGDGLTMEAWINPSDITNYDPILEYNADDAVTYWGPHLYVLPTGDGKGQLYANVQGVGDNWHQMWSAPGLVTPNTPQHVALTYDKASGVARLYLNGAVVVETAFGSFTPKTTGNLNIGSRPIDPAGSQFTFTGVIDEPSVYNRALSSNEIAAIYNAGSAGKCDDVKTNSGSAPIITSQATNQTVAAGANVAFSVTATGSSPLHFQWYDPSETLIPGATTSTLTLSNVQPSAAGAYFVVVTNQFGFAISSNAVLTVTGGTNSNSCTPPPSGIAAWWPAETNGADIIGGATATLHGGATFGPGEVGQAFLLNGTNDYLSAASSNLNIAAGGSFTVEAWINVSDLTAYHPIVEWNDNAGHAGVHLWILPYTGQSSDVLFANLVDTSGNSHAFNSPGGSASANVFQHVALTYDQSSGIATIYVNGNIVAQETLGTFTPQTSYPLWMGHRPNDMPGDSTYGAYLGGLLDELSLYSRALSQSEIAAIYHAGANGKCPPSQITQHTAINPAPTVNMSLAGNSSVLSWPMSAGNFVLQSTLDLTPPINWTNVPATFTTNGNNIQVTLPAGSKQGYFRLYQP